MAPSRRTRPRRAPRAPRFASGLRAALVALALAAPSVSAATPSAPEADVSAWVGRYCTPLGCSGAVESALGNAFGFGAAAVTVAWLARRRRA